MFRFSDLVLESVHAQLDLVVVSSGGYFSFAVERRPNVGGSLFAALIAILLILLGKQQSSTQRRVFICTWLHDTAQLLKYLCVGWLCRCDLGDERR